MCRLRFLFFSLLFFSLSQLLHEYLRCPELLHSHYTAEVLQPTLPQLTSLTPPRHRSNTPQPSLPQLTTPPRATQTHLRRQNITTQRLLLRTTLNRNTTLTDALVYYTTVHNLRYTQQLHRSPQVLHRRG
jgi:hypothetical protein